MFDFCAKTLKGAVEKPITVETGFHYFAHGRPRSIDVAR